MDTGHCRPSQESPGESRPFCMWLGPLALRSLRFPRLPIISLNPWEVSLPAPAYQARAVLSGGWTVPRPGGPVRGGGGGS